ncbi:MAG TPA: protein kinase [Thermoanaerobaculia bacterium]|nr:protein kinase [Thermoanaerobaculia bacterium]
MSSNVEVIAPGSTLLNYRLTARLGDAGRSTVWQAEDVRSGKAVAIKFLSRQLPREPAKREALVRDVRQAATLFHPSLAAVQEVAQAGDNLVLVTELVEGLPIWKRLAGKALDKSEFFRLAYQAADGLRFIHSKNLVHGNIGGDTLLVTPSGQLKIVGFNLSNLTKREGQPTAFQQKGSEARAVAYMAPEQITGQPPADARTDIFCLGMVFYEMATGKLPFQGAPADVARRIVEEQPPSPKALNSTIDSAVLSVLGRCLFKDPMRRQKEAKAICDEIAKADPDAAKFATELASHAATAAAPAAQSAMRHSILLLADIANYDELVARDPQLGARAASRMQQVLGESVYLFDGQVVDPFGPRMVAELPGIENALEAARKGEFDFVNSDDGLQVRLLLHAGDVTTREGQVVGEAVAKGTEALQQLPALKLYISEAFVKEGRGNVRLRDAGAKAGVKLYTIVAAEPEAGSTPPEPVVEAAPEIQDKRAGAAPAAQTKKAGSSLGLVAALIGLVVVVGGAGLFLYLRGSRSEPARGSQPRTQARAALPPATIATPRKVFVAPLTTEGTDPALADRASAIRLATIEILRSFPEVKIVDSPAAPDASSYSASLRAGAAGPEIIPATGGAKPVAGQPAALLDSASGINALIGWIASDLKLAPHTPPATDACNAFADAVAAQAANLGKDKIEGPLRAALKADPKFLAAQLFAMTRFSAEGNEKDAIDSARQVAALDPNNVDAGRLIARASLATGDLVAAFGGIGAILKKNPNDLDALNLVGRYAVAAGDTARVGAVLDKLGRQNQAKVAVHEPDLLVAQGKIESAIDKYYDIEVNVPKNPALSLKIGRISVLRHSTPIAEIELKKLEELDPKYGYHLLQAYLAAQKSSPAVAAKELATAHDGSVPGDDYYSCAAEVYAMSADTKNVIASLEKAVQRKEPTASYLLANPLFRYLASDGRFQKVRAQIEAEQGEIRNALAQVGM